MNYLDHLARESVRFAAALHGVPGDVRVPSCPDWDADDLLWHLAEVQWFWGAVVRDGLTGAEAEKLTPPRPAGRVELEASFHEASAELHRVLAATDPRAPAWSWAAEQTVGFTYRRQAHEALIHRIDAELLAAQVNRERTSMDPLLSADGVDEVLRIMYGGAPPWGRFDPDPDPRSVRLTASDTGHTWVISLGRFSGTQPDGTAYDEPDVHPADDDDGARTSAALIGRAEDLDCWLWHRPPAEELRREGDEAVLAAFEKIIGPGIS